MRLFLPSYAGINEVKKLLIRDRLLSKCIPTIDIYSCIMLVLLAHTFDQLVYALVTCSYAPHAFTLVLLELVISAMQFSCKQLLLINACMNQHAYTYVGNHR